MPAVEPAEPQLPPFDHTPAPYQGPSKEEVHALRKQYLSPGVGRLICGYDRISAVTLSRLQQDPLACVTMIVVISRL